MEIIDGLACIQYEENIGNFIYSKQLKEMVLESDPGFMYYGRFSFPLSNVKHNLYFIVKPFKTCHLDNILRVYQDVKKLTGLEFAAAPGQLKLFNVMQACIKIQVESVEDIPVIIDAYKEKGVSFIKNKKIDTYKTLITTKEYIKMEEIEPYIYKDTHNNEISYVEIDKYLDWELFKKTSEIAKKSFHAKDYTVSQVSIYKEQSYREFVSLYVRGGCDCDILSDIRKSFINID